ncbi:hypothetical protein JY651_17675 [Pyxidicoccus parkwayensis]|uniref:Lipoprotein n=1 Tax=Pyxidicoccus parkwayensis TaxID=2813578 RepID=A0ABX7P863_9BACT|nr:hypothetical protein [Pyxidicoccus parkwaysis]QSQ26645.1 hypothetical protein JY651_17675 [Pyxidicoccus parkwaysis]
MSLSLKSPWLAATITTTLVAGIAWSLGMTPGPTTPSAPAPVPAPTAPVPAAPGASADAARLRQLEQQVEQLSQRLGAEETARANVPPPPLPPTPEELAQRREAGMEMFEMKVDAYQQERMDPAWADPARKSLETSMGTLLTSLPADRRGHLLNVDCRTHSCMATLEFPNFAAAKDQFPRFVEHMYDVPCGRTAVLDDAEDPTAPLKVRVLFDECAHN